MGLITIFKIPNLLSKHTSFPVMSQESPKMSFILTYNNYKCQKLRLKKWCADLPVFFAIAQPNMNKVLSFFYAFCLHMALQHLFHVDRKIPNFEFSSWWIAWNEILKFGYRDRNILKIRGRQFVEDFTVKSFDVSFLPAINIRIIHSRRFWTIAAFYSKWWKDDVTKTILIIHWWRHKTSSFPHF